MKGIADYEFVEELGSGNHGRFYRAIPPSRLDVEAEHVAVKVLERGATDAEFKRMATELRVFASVRSDHLVRVYDAGSNRGLLYYCMAHYPEGSLASPARPLGGEEVARAVADAARGAHALHEVGVVHRDIKPANVLIEDGRGRLSDLGLARVLAPGMTTTGVGPIGSIEFMAPGIITGERASRRTDIWSLGATLHRALTGEGLFGDIPDDNVLEAFTHVLHGEPNPHPDLAPPHRAIIERCLERSGGGFATAQALADALDPPEPPEETTP
ncbi:MAG: serine/threonine-protein kinase [Miltoncostaeaceae bacterium]